MSKQPDIFVSYPRNHERLAARLVQLLKTSERLIFLDRVSLQPGDHWASEIEGAIRSAKTLVFLWCGHASESEWVLKEIGFAEQFGKRIVPVLLDDTPLPTGMQHYQWIDFRQDIVHSSKRSVLEVVTGTLMSVFGGFVVAPVVSVPAMGATAPDEELLGDAFAARVMQRLDSFDR